MSFLWRVAETTLVQLSASVAGKAVERAAQPAVDKAKELFIRATVKPQPGPDTTPEAAVEVPEGKKTKTASPKDL